MRIAISGSKGSGKSTLAKYVALNSGALFGREGKVLSLAGPLKELCVKILGLDPKLVYGTDDDKNALTDYLWEKLPHYDHIIRETANWALRKVTGRCVGIDRLPSEQPNLFDILGENDGVGIAFWMNLPSGPMTVRQVLQQAGDMLRYFDPDILVKALVREADAFDGVVVCDDFRRQNEWSFLKKEGFFTVRLTRGGSNDPHITERDLDPAVFNWDNFDHVLDNKKGIDARTTFALLWSELIRRGLAVYDGSKEIRWAL